MTGNIRKNFRALNIVLLICAGACLVCYDIFGGLWLKGVTSAWFVLLGMANLAYARKMGIKKRAFLLLMEAGLVFGMCADVLLGIEFMLGILFFAMGHVVYLIAFCRLEKPCARDLVFILPIAAVSLFIVAGTPWIHVEDPFMEKMLLGYAVIIACMLGKAVSNYISDKNLSRLLILLGSTMFWFSDVILAIDMFGASSRLTWILCSYAYWPAQNIMAHGMFHYINEKSA